MSGLDIHVSVVGGLAGQPLTSSSFLTAAWARTPSICVAGTGIDTVSRSSVSSAAIVGSRLIRGYLVKTRVPPRNTRTMAEPPMSTRGIRAQLLQTEEEWATRNAILSRHLADLIEEYSAPGGH